MNINSIKRKVEDLGYFSYIDGGDLMVGKKVGEDSDLGALILENFCLLIFEGIKVTIDYGESNLPEEIEFTSESKAIAFIRKEFPL